MKHIKRVVDFLRRVWRWISRGGKRIGNSGPLPPFKRLIPAPVFNQFQAQHMSRAARRRRIAKARRVHP